ncbi:MAG: hypothetical protein M3140_07365 [Actinomycetota bacterium]|nr:hypothetical protein [Actinomycetota bacterium]
MATVGVRGAGHPGDPFQVRLVLSEDDVNRARAPESLVLDPPDVSYDADPQIRTVIVQISDDS